MEPDPNHGKARIRTSESLNEAYMMWVPSGDPHSASGDDKMSSVKECCSIKTTPFVVNCDVSESKQNQTGASLFLVYATAYLGI